MRNISKAGILMVTALSMATIGASAAAADHGGPHCDVLPANITPAHPNWHDSLDANHDGIGCEDDSAPPWQPEPPAPEPTVPPAPTPTVAPAPLPTPAPPARPVPGRPDFTG